MRKPIWVLSEALEQTLDVCLSLARETGVRCQKALNLDCSCMLYLAALVQQLSPNILSTTPANSPLDALEIQETEHHVVKQPRSRESVA